MKGFLGTYRDSRIVKSFIRRILLIQLISLIIIIIISVFTLQPLLKEQSTRLVSDTNTYMANILDSTLESIKMMANNIMSSEELNNSLSEYNDVPSEQSFQNVQLTLNKLISDYSYIRGVVLDAPNDIRFFSIAGINQEEINFHGDTLYQSIAMNDYGQAFSIISDTEENAFSFLFAKNTFIGSKRHTLTIVYNATPILDSMKQYSQNTFAGFMLMNLNNTVLFKKGEIDTSSTSFVTNNLNSTAETVNGVIFVNTITSSMWKVVSFADNATISLMYRNYLLTTVLLFLFSSILTFLLQTPAISNRLKPINVLSEAMSKITDNHISPETTIHSKDEIGDLSRGFNRMISNLNEYITKTIQHEKNEQRMKYSLLISQIDPHFIYNTLSIINSLARNNRSEDIIAINTSLIEILQDRLRVNAIEVFDSVGHEINIVKNYLLIQNHRYENHADIIWEIDKSLMNMQIPKNIIQPLVENALFHGLIDEETGEIAGKIKIIIRMENHDFFICVQDNGRGITQERIQKMMNGFDVNEENRGRHIGLKNIHERLKYLYDSNSSMDISGDKGTSVTIRIKVQPNGKSTTEGDLLNEKNFDI